MNDVIIIGGGPAGLSAAIYTSREMLSTLLLEKGICGGLPAATGLIENYPGFSAGIDGGKLTDEFKKQAQRFGAVINEFSGVKVIKKTEKGIEVYTEKEKHTAPAVIIAGGSLPKKLGIAGENELLGKGVSYCATCDGPLFRGKEVAVIGGGNGAAQEAIFLSGLAQKVFLVHRRNELRAAKSLQVRLRENKKIELLLNYVPVSIDGKEIVESLTIKEKTTGEEKKINISAVFIYAGFTPNSQMLEGAVEMDENGYILTDENMLTSAHGIYAAGDIRSKSVRQISTACAEGTVAAISVRNYLKGL